MAGPTKIFVAVIFSIAKIFCGQFLVASNTQDLMLGNLLGMVSSWFCYTFTTLSYSVDYLQFNKLTNLTHLTIHTIERYSLSKKVVMITFMLPVITLITQARLAFVLITQHCSCFWTEFLK